MWPRRLHILAPLTRLTSIKRKFKWTQVEQDDFGRIKRIVAHDILLTYMGFNETFIIHNDDSAFQLEAFMSQRGKPIAFYSRKLTGSKKGCIVT